MNAKQRRLAKLEWITALMAQPLGERKVTTSIPHYMRCELSLMAVCDSWVMVRRKGSSPFVLDILDIEPL